MTIGVLRFGSEIWTVTKWQRQIIGAYRNKTTKAIRILQEMISISMHPCWRVCWQELEYGIDVWRVTRGTSLVVKKTFSVFLWPWTIPLRYVLRFSYRCLYSRRTLWNALYNIKIKSTKIATLCCFGRPPHHILLPTGSTAIAPFLQKCSYCATEILSSRFSLLGQTYDAASQNRMNSFILARMLIGKNKFFDGLRRDLAETRS
jgi:hypothetical protein